MPSDDELAAELAVELDLDFTSLFPTVKGKLGQIAEESGADTLLDLNFSPSDAVFQTTARSTTDWAAARAAELVGMHWDEASDAYVQNPNPEWSISETTRAGIKDVIRQALSEGWSATKVRDAVMESFQFGAPRSLMIARTERNLAQQYGSLIAAQKSGVVKTKEWVRGGELPCDVCEENEAAGALALDDDFPSGDAAPPSHPNCVCSLAYNVSDDSEAPTDDEGEVEAGLGLTAAYGELLRKLRKDFNPDEARDEHGEWTEGGGSAAAAPAAGGEQEPAVTIRGGVTLTRGQYDALVGYSGDGYKKTNAALRNGASIAATDHCREMIEGLGRMKAYSGKVFRAETYSRGLPAALTALKKGDEYASPAFLSTTRSWITMNETVEDAKYSVSYTITSKSGRELATISSEPQESEVLFAPRATFKVSAVERAGNRLRISLREIVK